MAGMSARTLGLTLAFALIASLITLWVAKPPSEEPQPEITPFDQADLVQRDRKCADLSQGVAIKVRCYWVAVSSSVSSPQLSVVVLTKNHSNTADALPVVYLPGGPGSTKNTARERLDRWISWYDKSELANPLILIDYRYASVSRPSAHCQEYRRAAKQLFAEDLSLAKEAERIAPYISSCLDHVHRTLTSPSTTHPLEEINSEQNASDTRIVMRALGFDRWHLLGVSYGARVALISALRHSEVQSILLDSPYSLNPAKDSDTPRLWGEALNRYFERNRQNDAEEQFWQAIEQLKEQPLAIISEHWENGEKNRWQLNGVRFTGWLFSTLYWGQSDERIREVIKAILSNDLSSIAIEFEIFYNQLFDEDFSEWLYWTTECNDSASETLSEFESALKELGRVGELFSGTKQFDICSYKRFKPGALPAMRTIKIPALVTVGDRDPITPVSQATKLMGWLPQGRLIVGVGAGHAEFVESTCGKRLIAAFFKGENYDDVSESQDCAWSVSPR